MAKQNASTRDRVRMMGNLIADGQLALRLMLDPRVATLSKIMIPALAVAYVLSPIDLVPDFIPVLGQIDDLAILALAVRLFIQFAPPAVVREHQAEMRGEPVQNTAHAGRDDETVDAEYRVIR